MRIVWEPLAEGTEGAPHLGPERPRVYFDLSPEEKDRYTMPTSRPQIFHFKGYPRTSTLSSIITLMQKTFGTITKESPLINDMRNIKMTMSRMQLNSKFVNNMLPEWGIFVTAVKLNRGLRDSNYDQLYAYLKKHETHAKENKMMLERFSQNTVDPLALMSNGGGATGYGGAQNRVRNVNPGQARPVKCYNCNGAGHIARNCTQPKRPQNFKYYKDKMLLMQAQANGVTLDAEQLLFLAGGQDNAFDHDVDEQPIQDLALNMDNVFQADDYPVIDEAGPSYDSDVLSEVQDHDHYQDAVCVHHEEHAMHDSVQLNHVVDSHADYMSDSNMIMYDQYVKDNEVMDRLLKQDQSLQIVHMLCRPKPYYNELNKVAIGYKNPLCLSHAKQVQPALYNGLEIIKDNYVPAIVHNTEDTLEIAEITRKKMNDKMKDPECVTRKVNIAPHDYSKESFLATFTPQKQLTPEQIFWSHDLINLKSEALKEQTTVSRPINVLTVYPPNKPTTLVHRVLPTKSQVKIHIFTLFQLFLEFDKTCKKRITPTGLTERERGFEQTKECYLKEIIPFFKTFKDNFEGIQKALTNEIKEIKDVFEELEAEFAQNVVDRKHDTIEQKNLLIANDNLIAECFSKEVFSLATNSELNVARLTEMHVANTIVEARCPALEAELANLRNTSHHDNQEELINHFSKIEVKPKVLAQGKHSIDVKPIVPRLWNNRDAHLDYLRHLKESVETIRDIVEEAKV
nr:hypothetical protein [Tanacetum cinerariifolium]